MVSRIAVFGSILLALSALAAIGLAQNGQPGEPDGNSLADRLTALRNSAATDGSAATAAPTASGGQPLSSRTHASVEPRQSTRPLRQAPRVQDVDESPRRPRLLSALDPLNLLSIGDDGDENAPNGPQGAVQRGGIPARQPSAIQRHGASVRDTPAVQRPAAIPSVERHYQARRSPAVRQAEELPPSTETAAESRGTALGPAASESVTLPSLDRPIGPLSRALSSANGAASETSDAASEEQDLDEGASDLQSRYSHATPEDELDSPDAESDDQNTDAAIVENDAVLPIEESDSTAGTLTEASPTVTPHTEVTRPTTRVSRTDALTTSVRSAEQVLSSDKAPAISWEVSGPRQVIVGREAEFVIHLHNEGGSAVAHLISQIEMPASTEIITAEASHGVGQRASDAATSTALEWRIDQLAAAEEAVLKLRVIPRTSQAMNLHVSVRTEPRAAVARVEVLEPKLQLAVEGPSDVLYGEARTYRLTVTNPGTGPAENVVIAFTPPGEEDGSAARHEVGLLDPGASRSIELEITPQVAGELAMKAIASADGDLRDDFERRVLVRKPELIVDARGPRTTYAGTVATYYFRVQNTGNAVAKDVNVQTHLPLGAEFIRATDDRNLEPQAEKNAVTWAVGSLSPGEEFFIELKCLINSAGENTLKLAAETPHPDLQHSKTIATHVVALADLKLEVTDPKGPVAVGKEAVYEVRIRNRGSNSAEQVNVVALFSEGIDPVSVEGGQHSIENGRVAFRTIEGLPAGREVVFKIRALAKQPGTHVFRAEVLCRELETKLAAEETTRFYLDEAGPGAATGFQAAVHHEVIE